MMTRQKVHKCMHHAMKQAISCSSWTTDLQDLTWYLHKVPYMYIPTSPHKTDYNMYYQPLQTPSGQLDKEEELSRTI